MDRHVIRSATITTKIDFVYDPPESINPWLIRILEMAVYHYELLTQLRAPIRKAYRTFGCWRGPDDRRMFEPWIRNPWYQPELEFNLRIINENIKAHLMENEERKRTYQHRNRIKDYGYRQYYQGAAGDPNKTWRIRGKNPVKSATNRQKEFRDKLRFLQQMEVIRHNILSMGMKPRNLKSFFVGYIMVVEADDVRRETLIDQMFGIGHASWALREAHYLAFDMIRLWVEDHKRNMQRVAKYVPESNFRQPPEPLNSKPVLKYNPVPRYDDDDSHDKTPLFQP